MKNLLSSKNTFSSRKNLPLFLTGGLTIFLLFLFGSEQFNEENSSNTNFANELYSTTLKPLFFSESIDEKDVLTFAVNGNLPLDEGNRVLQVSKNSDGQEILEIIRDREIVLNNDYSRIVKKLKLTEDRKAKFDSILKSYQYELSNLVYLGDDSLIAVDPKIGLLRNSINYDLSTFIKEIQYNLLNKPHLTSMNSERLYDVLNNQSENKPRNYVVFTPDSILKREYHFVELEDELLEFQHKIIVLKTPKKIEPIEDTRFSFEIDSNFARVTVDNIYGDDLDLNDLNLFSMVIDSTQSDVKLSFEIVEDSTENITVKFSYVDSLNNSIKYEMNSDNIAVAFSNSLKLFSGKNLDEWIEYGIKMDSISRAMDSTMNDKIISPKQRNN